MATKETPIINNTESSTSTMSDVEKAPSSEPLAPIIDRNGKLLLELALNSFPSLTPQEGLFFRMAGMLNLGDVVPDVNDTDKTIRADRLAWVLLDSRAVRLLTPVGVMVFGANITGKIRLNKCRVNVPLRLDTCRFAEDILLQDAKLSLLSLQGNQCGGLNAERMIVDGGIVRFGDTTFSGIVNLLGAKIYGSLECDNSKFINQDDDGICFMADGIEVNGSMYCKKASFHGEVRLIGATIGGNLECDGANFLADNEKYSLNADSIIVKNNVFLRNSCNIGGVITFSNANIYNFLQIHGVIKRDNYFLCLSHAKVGALWDDKDSWPNPGKLWVDGFHYSRLYDKSVLGLTDRLVWLSRHACSEGFDPQPYEQLAKVYRESGHETDAKEVLVVKNWKAFWNRFVNPRKWIVNPLNWVELTLQFLIGFVCAFGYKPLRAAFWWVALWLYVWDEVIKLEYNKLLVPSLTDIHATSWEPIEFTASGYAFDLITPIFDMGYTQAWAPVDNETALFLLSMGTIGYILVALLAASIAKLIRW